MKKRALSLLLALVMCLALLPTAALAVEDVIWLDYDYISDFYNGFAEVRKGDKCGYIDTSGRLIGPMLDDYDPFDEPLPHMVKGFHEGLCAVRVGRKFGFINTSGKLVIPCEYDYVRAFSEGLAQVEKDQKRGIINTSGQIVVPCIYDGIGIYGNGIFVVEYDGQTKYINASGQEAFPFLSTYDNVYPVGSLMRVEKNGQWGLIDYAGNTVVEIGEYAPSMDPTEAVPNFREGLAKVQKDGKWGYINTSGELVIPCEYSSAGGFSEGVAWVAQNGKWGIINSSGQLIAPCEAEYLMLFGFSSGLSLVSTNTRLVSTDARDDWFYVDTTGKRVLSMNTDDYSLWDYGFLNGLTRAYKESKFGIVNTSGRLVVPCKYDDVSYCHEGLIRVGNRDSNWECKYGYVDTNGKEIVPLEYDEATDFQDGFAVVQKDGKYGLLKNPLFATRAPAKPSAQTVVVDGKPVEFEMYALTDTNGGVTNYIRVRDLAAVLNGSAAQFEVGWNGNVNLLSKTAYTGKTDKAPFDCSMPYDDYTAPTYVNGAAANLEAISIQYAGGGYTYYKLRDLGQALGFNVGWSAGTGIYVETDKPYDPSN